MTGSLPSPVAGIVPPRPLSQSWTFGPNAEARAAPSLSPQGVPPHFPICGPSLQRLTLQTVKYCVTFWVVPLSVSESGTDVQGEGAGFPASRPDGHPGRCPEPWLCRAWHKHAAPQGRCFAILFGHRPPFLWQLQVFSAVIWMRFFSF